MLGLTYTLPQVAACAGAQDLFQGVGHDMPLRALAFDSRRISKGAETVFIALPGPHRHGHDFVQAAYDKGVRNFILAKPPALRDVNYALSNDPLDFLQRWARFHRQQMRYPVVGITGSNGKTIVKEWLATLLEADFQLAKSPMSYNSQLGVAVSLLGLRADADLALIEAGISRAGEMGLLHAMIAPTHGLLTHFGAAHAEGFADEGEKFREKCLLFEGCQRVWMHPREAELAAQFGVHFPAHQVVPVAAWPPELPLAWLLTPAQRENARLAATVAVGLGLPPAEAEGRLALLAPVEMRTEIISDNPEITLINDTYNSDPDSARDALQLLMANASQPRKLLVMSDLAHQGRNAEDIHRALLHEAEGLLGAAQVLTIGPIFARLRTPQAPAPGGAAAPAYAYPSTEALRAAHPYAFFRGATVLLKGARAWALEQLVPHLQRKPNATRYEIRLDALRDNFRAMRGSLPPGTKAMCMVKALAYGSGTWEIAQALADAGAEYLAVAYISEGIALREKGIRLPIMVMNPDPGSLHALAEFDLEPEIYDFALLEKYIRTARMYGQPEYRIHLKFDTGMGRLGFLPADLPALTAQLAQFPDVQVRSVMSHLAAADLPEADAFTRQQIGQFSQICQALHHALGISPLRHILNTPGILRFPEAAFDMVRMGMGLYGPVAAGLPARGGPPLREIGTLASHLSQIHAYPAGTPIGYGCSEVLARPSRIGTVPMGYADGIPRDLGNRRAGLLVHGQLAPIVGRVCMDMLMLDLTDIPAAAPGDEVVAFGAQGAGFQSIHTLAAAADTIAYELLVRISPRVRRVYLRD